MNSKSEFFIPPGNWSESVDVHACVKIHFSGKVKKYIEPTLIQIVNVNPGDPAAPITPHASDEDMKKVSYFLGKFFPHRKLQWEKEFSKLSGIIPSEYWLPCLKYTHYLFISQAKAIDSFRYIRAILSRWHAEGLPEDRPWERYDDDMNPIPGSGSHGMWMKGIPLTLSEEDKQKIAEQEATLKGAATEWKSRSNWRKNG